ncbi:aldo/keto reductase [Azospirillum sp.]|uniref:aldo/keto reductase n=1 Tax=Azospirillum sp. TaxID=34012 RepID=UPI002D66AB86|nr:aldo/keto reductase [Azospirillum sp.]HYD66363.1 aldo/keto reductase [Azospirillum sp.]
MKTFTRGGSAMPALGLGTWQLTGSACERTVRAALDLGYRHLDTAQMYGNEAEVGRALAASGVPRDDVFVTTKVWMDRLGRADVLRSTADSLRALGTGWIDLLLIHWPNPRIPLAETLGAMAELKAAGTVRQIGVSNFPVALVRQAVEEVGAELFCDQVEYHPLLSQRPLLGELRRHGMVLTAYSPLAHGAIPREPTVARIAAKHGRTAAQVAIAWLLAQDNVAAIPKALSESHLRANLEAADLTLDADDLKAMDALQGGTRTCDPGWSPRWDT